MMLKPAVLFANICVAGRGHFTILFWRHSYRVGQ